MKKLFIGVLLVSFGVQAQDFHKVVDIVGEMESSLKTILQQEQTQRTEDVAALHKEITELRSLIVTLQAEKNDKNSPVMQARLDSLEVKLNEIQRTWTAFIKSTTTPANSSAAERKALNFTFTGRARIETWDNTVTLSKAAAGGTSYSRIKTTAQMQWLPSADAEFTVRLANEFRNYFAPVTKPFTSNEIFFDNLLVKYNFHDFAPVTITAGRQNFSWGEGFVVMDGTPLDGSRSTYFTAVRGDIVLNSNVKLSSFYSYQPSRDTQLPLVNDQKQGLVEQPEEGIGVTGNVMLSSILVQPYFLRKNMYTTNASQINSRINAAGSRVQLPIADVWTLTAEAAYQFGSYGTVDRQAYGGYGTVEFKTGLTGFLPKTITAGYVYLSGDDLHTQKYEAWDPLFGRFPKWNETFPNVYINEKAVAYWSNTIIERLQAAFAPWNGVGVTLEYQHLEAPQQTLEKSYKSGTATIPFMSGTGTTRGNLLITKVSYKLSDIVTGYTLWERFVPGDFYAVGSDISNWVRIEFLITI